MNGAPQDDSEDEHVRCLIKLGVRRSRSCRDRVRRTSTSDPGQPGGGGGWLRNVRTRPCNIAVV